MDQKIIQCAFRTVTPQLCSMRRRRMLNASALSLDIRRMRDCRQSNAIERRHRRICLPIEMFCFMPADAPHCDVWTRARASYYTMRYCANRFIVLALRRLMCAHRSYSVAGPIVPPRTQRRSQVRVRVRSNGETRAGFAMQFMCTNGYVSVCEYDCLRTPVCVFNVNDDARTHRSTRQSRTTHWDEAQTAYMSNRQYAILVRICARSRRHGVYFELTLTTYVWAFLFLEYPAFHCNNERWVWIKTKYFPFNWILIKFASEINIKSIEIGKNRSVSIQNTCIYFKLHYQFWTLAYNWKKNKQNMHNNAKTCNTKYSLG